MDESHERKYEKPKRRNNSQRIKENKKRSDKLFQNRLLYLDIEDGTVEILKLVVSE